MAAGALALALFLPLGLMSVDSQDGDYKDTVTYADYPELNFMERMNIVGNTSAGAAGYSREKIYDELADNSTYEQQFDVLIYNLFEHEFLDAQAYDSISSGYYEQAVTHYTYMVDNSPALEVSVVDRSYYSPGICKKIDISVGLDKDTGAALYIYLNFYSLADEFELNWGTDEVRELFVQGASALLGISDDDISDIDVNQDVSGSRFNITLDLMDSTVFKYTLGVSYDAGEDRYQLYIVPSAT